MLRLWGKTRSTSNAVRPGSCRKHSPARTAVKVFGHDRASPREPPCVICTGFHVQYTTFAWRLEDGAETAAREARPIPHEVNDTKVRFPLIPPSRRLFEEGQHFGEVENTRLFVRDTACCPARNQILGGKTTIVLERLPRRLVQ